MSRGKTNLFGRNGEREVVRVEKDGKVTYLSYLVVGHRRSPGSRFVWEGGEEEQVRQWLQGGPDPE